VTASAPIANTTNTNPNPPSLSKKTTSHIFEGSNMPSKNLSLAETSYQKYKDHFKLNKGWEPYFEEENVISHKMAEDGFICVRGEGSINASAKDILRFVLETKTIKQAFTKLTDIDIINVYSHHCFSRIIKFEKVIFIHI
jgi:hypothetical protein